jgi:hypothetical protein
LAANLGFDGVDLADPARRRDGDRRAGRLGDLVNVRRAWAQLAADVLAPDAARGSKPLF